MTVEGIFTSKYSDARIDYINFGDSSEDYINVTWDSSEWWDEEDGSRHFYCKGVYFNDEYANGRIDELNDKVLIDYQLYSPSEDVEYCDSLDMESICFADGDGRTAWFIRG